MEKYVLFAIFAEGDEIRISEPTVEKNKLEKVVKKLKSQPAFNARECRDRFEIRRA